MLVMGMAVWGIYSMVRLPIDAVPDITNNQVQIVSTSAALAPQEMEQFVTYPVEVAMANLPGVVEIRSISRFGLSVVTVVFEDHIPLLEARQYVKEQISVAEQQIPEGLAKPELMPITSGLGEIYQYVLKPAPGFEADYGPMELRTIQDWIVKRQLAGISGIIEVSSFGGFLKQYEVAIDPLRLRATGSSLQDVIQALESNNQNTGGSYLEKGKEAFYIRAEGVLKDPVEIENIVIAHRSGLPIRVRDVAVVQLGSPKRYGAMTMNGLGETVGGITLMLKGANSSEAIRNVHRRIAEVQTSLPEGVVLEPYLDRSDLVQKTIKTVRNNLVEGGLIVVFVLLLLLGNWRASLIVASIIPLAMLFALILMRQLGISANLMSLGAIDFGIVVDGAVIVVEGVLHALLAGFAGQQLSKVQMDELVIHSTTNLFRSAFFGVLIILVVFLPVVTLTGIEGKMYRPMALTFSFVILGALILSLTFIPMASALVLNRQVSAQSTWSNKLIDVLRTYYLRLLQVGLKMPILVVVLAVCLLGLSAFGFSRLGAEFLPTLEEGDLAMQMTIAPGSSLQESVATTTKAEQLLLDRFPEVQTVVSKIGTAEVPTDPMAIEDADIMIILKDKADWTSADNRESLVEKMKVVLEGVPEAAFEFTQPIQLRFNELLSGTKSDIAVKIFGEDPETLRLLGEEAVRILATIEGAADVRLEQTEGRQELQIQYDRRQMARYGMEVKTLNEVIRTAFAGRTCGSVYEAERRFDLVVRLDTSWRKAVNLSQLFVPLENGELLPLSAVAHVEPTQGPIQVSRENARRRITVGVNVRGRDLEGVVQDIQAALNQSLSLPAGYYIGYGGDFEQLQQARQQLAIAVPVALLLIFILLYFAFGKIGYVLLILSAVPFSAVGGVAALLVRGMPFSISAGIGFIALFGVSVLNGIVLISYINELKAGGGASNLKNIIVRGAEVRFRPILITAAVAAAGFLPMAISVSNGAEVQRPLATVVIGGLISATLLSLLVLPVLYYLLFRNNRLSWNGKMVLWALAGILISLPLAAQQQDSVGLDQLIELVETTHPSLEKRRLMVDMARQDQMEAQFIPPTQFQFDLGAINEPQLDYRFQVLQPFSPIALNKEKKKLGALKEVAAQAQLANQIQELVYQTRLAWLTWTYQSTLHTLVEEQLVSLQRLYNLAVIQLEAGAINQVEFNLTGVKLSRLQQIETEARIQVENAKEAILRLAGLPLETLLVGDSLRQFISPLDTVGGNLWLLPVRREIEVAAQEIEVFRKGRNPSFAVGYFIQSIRPIYGLQGGILGLNVPLARKSMTAKVEKAELRQLQVQQDYELKRRDFEQTLSTTLRAIRAWDRQVIMLQEQKLQRQNLRQLAQQQLEAGAVDYFIFYQALEESLAAEVQYFGVLYQYNQAVLLLERLNQ